MDADARQAIADQWAKFKTALLNQDVARWQSFWSPDLRMLQPGLDLCGPEYLEFGRNFFESGGKVFAFDWRTIEVFVHGDVAYEVASYDESFQFSGQEVTTVNHHAFVRWEKQTDGEWRISRLLGGPRDAPAES